jgi:hypothetical protein
MELSEKINIIHEMINASSTTGSALGYLPDLLKALGKANETKKYMIQLETQIDEVETSWRNSHKEAHEWMCERIKLLKISKWAKFPKVKNCIEQAEQVLNFEINLLPPYFFSEALNATKAAANAIAEFGKDPIFEGWANIDRMRVSSLDIKPGFPLKKVGVVSLTDAKKRAVATKLGHGVDCWDIKKMEKQHKSEPDKLIAYLCRGYVSEYLFPPCFDVVFGNACESSEEQEKHEWLEKTESDPVLLLRHLQWLSNYKTMKPLTMALDAVPRTIEDAIVGLQQAYTGLFLSSLSRNNPEDYFISKEEVIKLIDLFLDHVALNIVLSANEPKGYQKVTSRKPADDPRTRDKQTAFKFIKPLWRLNPYFSQSSILFGLNFAINSGVLKLEDTYKESTFKTWIRKADQPLKERPRRSRRKSSQHIEQIKNFVKEKERGIKS